MTGVDHIQDRNDTGSSNDAASTALVNDWLGDIPKHDLKPDAASLSKSTDAAKPGSANSDLASERNQLKAHAEQSIKDPKELAEFKTDMARFEQRAATNNPPIPANEIAGTYKEVDRLLTAQDSPGSPLHAEDRRKLVEQVMSQAVDQSLIMPSPDTCGAAAIEKALYAKYPAEAAKVVADVATTGKFTTPEGQTVPIDKESIAYVGNNVGAPSHASQIFQVATVNTFYHKHYPDGTVKFEQRGSTDGKDDGERVVDTSGLTKGISGIGAGLMTPDTVSETASLMSGKNDIEVIRYKDTPGCFDLNQKEAQNRFGDHLSKEFDNEGQLKDMLVQAKHDGKLPIIMDTNAGNNSFGTDSETYLGHVITVLDYDEKTGKVLIDTNGLNGAQKIDIDDLYHSSMKLSTTEKNLEQETKQNRESRIVDTTKELELLKLHQWKLPPQKGFATQYKQILDRAHENWDQQKQQGTFDQAEHDRVAQMALDLSNQRYADGPTAMELLQALHNAGIISNTDYTQSAYDNILKTSKQIRSEYTSGNVDDVADSDVREFKQHLTPPQQAYLDKLLQEPR